MYSTALDAILKIIPLNSRKWVATFATVGILLMAEKLQLSENQLIAITSVASAYIVGQGLADQGKEAAALDKVE